MQKYRPDDVDYHSLIRLLSLSPAFPYSIHVRNHLLAPFAALPPQPSGSEQDPWATYLSYRKGAHVIVIGDVPKSILKVSNSTDKAANGEHAGLWGVAMVFPSYAPGWVEPEGGVETNDFDIWHGVRLSMWISSEDKTAVHSDGEKSREITTEEEALLDFVFRDFVPRAARTFRQGSDGSKEMTIDLFALNDVWVDALRRWTEKGGALVQLTRANPCMMFIKAEDEVLAALAKRPPMASPNLEVSTIGEGDVEMVQKANSLTFPIWYINNRKHISVMIREGQEAVAWAYAHDDLSMASLHVLPSYRRRKLGQLCVNAMIVKLIQAQKEALKLAGFDDAHNLQTPAFLDTEMHKGASRSFFETEGFSGTVILTWGSIIVRLD